MQTLVCFDISEDQKFAIAGFTGFIRGYAVQQLETVANSVECRHYNVLKISFPCRAVRRDL